MSAVPLDETTQLIVTFLNDVGIRVTEGSVADGTFLPGVEVVDGTLVVDPAKLAHPGDLLHEGGHLAVAPASLRVNMTGEVETPGAAPQVVELEAILWSYAACLYLGLDPRVVFHPDGYHGQSEALLQNFSLGVYLGVQGLELAGMTLSPADAAASGMRPYPAMQKWLKD